MTELPANVPFLVISKHHLSPTKAREAVIRVLRQAGEARPNGDWDNLIANWKTNPPTSSTFAELVKKARDTGIVREIQHYLDKQDGVFGGISTEEFAVANYQIRHSTKWGSFSLDQQGPCRMAWVEVDLTEDIFYARRQCCEHSDKYDFVLCCRYFRNYLSACISLVDAFINRHLHVAKETGVTSPELDELQKTTKLEKRIELWWNFCSKDDISTLIDSVPYCHFQELRKRRNILLHAIEPIAGYQLWEIQSYLNKVRSGIGELLLLMRRAYGQETLGFIEQLRSAPKVAFHKVRLRADAHVTEKVKLD